MGQGDKMANSCQCFCIRNSDVCREKFSLHFWPGSLPGDKEFMALANIHPHVSSWGTIPPVNKSICSLDVWKTNRERMGNQFLP